MTSDDELFSILQNASSMSENELIKVLARLRIELEAAGVTDNDIDAAADRLRGKANGRQNEH